MLCHAALRYNTYGFGGMKYLVLSTTTWAGGKNALLGMAALVTGGFTVLTIGMYMVILINTPSEGDLAKMATSWEAELH